MDALPTPLLHVGAVDAPVSWNRAWLEVAGGGWPGSLHPEDRDAWSAASTQTRDTGSPVPVGCRVQHGRGWRELELTVRPCEGCGGVLATCCEQAQASASRYRMLLEHARDVVLFVGPDGRILEANGAAEKAYGYTRDELLGLTIQHLRAPETHSDLEPQLREAREHGLLFETLHRRKDGTVFPVEVSSQAAIEDGQTILLSVIRDITSRRRSEADLRLNKFAVDHSGEAAFRVDAAGRFLYANDAACRQLGYTAAELRDLHVWDVNPEFNDTRWQEHWKEIQECGTLSFDSLHLRKDRSLLSTEVNANLVEYEGQQLICAFVRDVTQRKRAEQALRQAHETVRALVNFSPLAIVGVDAQSNVTSWNPAATRIFGWEEWEVLGRPYPLVAPPEKERFREFMDVLTHGTPIIDQEVQRVTRDGRTLDVRVCAAPIRSSGRLDGVVAVLMDITERKHLEEQLRHAQRMEAIGCLAGGMAHDFNNLLTVMNGHAFHLLDHLGPADPAAENVREIVRAGERAGALIRQLLAFSRRQPLRPQVLCLNNVVSELKRMLVPLIGEDVELVTRLEENLGKVRVDPVQIEQILMNLAVNARDAMPDGGRLQIRTANAVVDEIYTSKHVGVTPGRYALLAVSDTGMGMDAATKARIFDPFFTTKDPGKGTGLGLSTVYGIVQQSGGHITVSSEPGHGATFRIYLPVVDSLPAEHPPKAPEDRATGSEAILLVEDEDAVRGFLRTVLIRQGYQVIEAPDGMRAMALCERRTERIDLLVTDLVMPGMSGVELARRVQKLRPGIRVLYMSGYSDHAAMGHERLSESHNFLQKPFSPMDLCAKVRAVLDAATE